MPQETSMAAIAHVIQLSVAPVFLLSGIGALLAVMTNRLGRVIDRARALEGRVPASDEEAAAAHARLAALARRARLANRAIALCTTTALLVAAVIVVLFLGAFLGFDAAVPVALLFIAAMVSLCAGLVFFLREIRVAAATTRFGPPARSAG